MGKRHTARQDLLPGTLDMLILKSLTRGVMHGTASRSIFASCRTKCCTRGGIAVSGAAAIAAPGADRLGLGAFDQQPACAILPADAGRPPAARPGGIELRPLDRGHYAGDATG